MTNTLIYKKADYHDSLNIADLHKFGIPTGFLSKHSPSFLELLNVYLLNQVKKFTKSKEVVTQKIKNFNISQINNLKYIKKLYTIKK